MHHARAESIDHGTEDHSSTTQAPEAEERLHGHRFESMPAVLTS